MTPPPVFMARPRAPVEGSRTWSLSMGPFIDHEYRMLTLNQPLISYLTSHRILGRIITDKALETHLTEY